MNITQTEENVKARLSDIETGKCSKQSFIYELLLAQSNVLT
jgi:hypothetical protein